MVEKKVYEIFVIFNLPPLNFAEFLVEIRTIGWKIENKRKSHF